MFPAFELRSVEVPFCAAPQGGKALDFYRFRLEFSIRKKMTSEASSSGRLGGLLG